MKDDDAQAMALIQPKRAYKPKVRTGCGTCKIRKVKCDETKPICLRCSSTGRKCDGYSPPKALMFEICDDAREKRSFYFFRDRTAWEIRTHDSSDFWRRLVIQASYSQEAVRHALVAIGSFHESLECSATEKGVEQDRFAVEQYNKAITALTKPKAELATEDVLLACIIFIWFENVRGNFDAALRHLRSGVDILTDWRARRATSQAPSGRYSVIADELGGILDLLHKEATTLLVSTRPTSDKQYSSDLPEGFNSLREAHHHFYRLVHWTCQELEAKCNAKGHIAVKNELVPEAIERFETLSVLLETFLVSPNATYSFSSSAKYGILLGSLHLKIQQRIVMIMLLSVPFFQETSFDPQLELFQEINSLVADYLTLKRQPDCDIRIVQLHAGFEFCIIPALFLVACRCRDPVTRREAIHLLRNSDSREDVWDSNLVAFNAEHIMQLEEKDLDLIVCAADVPDKQRLHMVGCTYWAYSPIHKRLELQPNHAFDPQWVKLQCIRSNTSLLHDGYEEFWLKRHGNADPVLTSQPGFFSQDVPGLFPQVIQPESQLWHILGGAGAVRFSGRFHAGNIFGAHGRGTSLRGDFVTISGEFTEYLAVERQFPVLV